MAFSKKDIVEDVITDLADAARLNEPKTLQFIREAIAIYSQHRPLIKSTALVGDGTEKKFSYPSDWSKELSGITSIEYPEGKDPPEYLAENVDWYPYMSSTGQVIRFKQALINGESALVTYTTIHTIGLDDGTLTTIPDIDRVAISFYTTARAAEELAASAMRLTKKPSEEILLITGPADDYIRLANRYYNKFFSHMGMSADGSGPAVWGSGGPDYIPSWNSGPVTRERRSPLPGA